MVGVVRECNLVMILISSVSSRIRICVIVIFFEIDVMGN